MNLSRIVAVGLLCSLVVCFVVPVVAGGTEKPVWKPIFDGRTFDGWHKNGQGEWTIEEGAMVGRANRTKLYGHLVSDKSYGDMSIRFNYKCSTGDSGFFIRTKMQEPDKTIGLQVQCGPLGSGNGGIYDSYGRGWLQHPTLDDEKEFYKKDGWNEMLIAAHGGKVTVHVNGIKSADLDDDKINPEGVLATQMHSDTDIVTHFKDMVILEKGQITPKQFLGRKLPTLKQKDSGNLCLPAAAANGVGPKIMYMPEWAAFGWWTDKDHVEWRVDVAKPGMYDVWVEWSVDQDNAGNSYALKIGDQTVSGKAEKTGGWEAFQRAKIGQIELTAGERQAVLRPVGNFDTALFHLRGVCLKPAK